MANSDLMSNLFGDGGLKTNPVSNPVEESVFFRPSSKKGQNNRFEAIVRFVPNIEDINKCTLSKFTVFLKDPRTGQGRTIDSPSTIGDHDPLSDMFFTLRNAKKNNPIIEQKKLDDNFKRHQNYYSLVQVIECKSDPSIVGKFLIWRYGDKINGKLKTEQTPVMQGMEPGQPFDLFKARLFKVVVTKNGEYDDFDQSLFFDIQYPANCLRMMVPTTDPQTGAIINKAVPATREIASTPEGQKQILEYLQNNCPKLSQCEYRSWDEETRKYVDDMIMVHSRIMNGENITSMQQNASNYQMAQNQPVNPMTPQTTPMNGGSLLGGSQPIVPQTPNVGAMNIPTSVPTPTPSVDNGAIPGLTLGDSPMPTATVTPTSVGGVDMVSIDNIMANGGASVESSASSNLSAVLGNIM